MSWRVSDKYYSSPFVQNVGCLRKKPNGNYCRELRAAFIATRRICMRRILGCKDCNFEEEIEWTPPEELKSKGIEVKGRPKCKKCGSENVEII